jgi:hypothetical protein
MLFCWVALRLTNFRGLSPLSLQVESFGSGSVLQSCSSSPLAPASPFGRRGDAKSDSAALASPRASGETPWRQPLPLGEDRTLR